MTYGGSCGTSTFIQLRVLGYFKASSLYSRVWAILGSCKGSVALKEAACVGVYINLLLLSEQKYGH